MPVSGPLAHIDVSVGDPGRSIPFYAALLEALGYRRWRNGLPEWQGERPTRATWGRRQADGTRFAIELRPARADVRDRRYDRYAPGPHHLAFHAASRAVVDDVHRAVVAAGGTVLDPPTEYGGQPGYGDAYYAAFFADPDGLKLEVVHVPSENP